MFAFYVLFSVLHCVVLILLDLTRGLHGIQVSEWGQILAAAKSDVDNRERLDEIFVQVSLDQLAKLSNAYGCYLFLNLSLTLSYQMPMLEHGSDEDVLGPILGSFSSQIASSINFCFYF